MMETFCRPFYQIERHQNTSDLVLVCKDNLKVFAHQFLLARHSPFLKQLFTCMASLERVELVTSRVEGVPDQLKMENLSQQTISLFVPDFTASTVEILLDLIYSGQSRSTGEIDPLSKQLNVINLYKDLGFDPNLMGGLPVIAELDQVLLEKREMSANHMNIKKEEYFEEFDENKSNENLTLRIMRANYDKVSSELEKLEVKNQKLEGQLLKMKENKVNRLSSSEKENGILKATIEEIEKFMKLFEDCDKINNELVIKIVQLEAAVDSNGKDKQGKGNATVTNQSSFEELKVVLKKDLEEKEKALENAKSDAEDLRHINNQLHKIRQSMRAKVNFAEEENTIMKDDLRKLIVELDQAVSKREFNKYSNIFKQIMERVRKNSENQSGINKERDYGRRFDSKSSSSNVNNDANVSKKRQSSEPDNGGQNKTVRESLSLNFKFD